MFASFVLIFAIALQNPAPRPTPQSALSQPPNQKSENSQQQPNTEQGGTQNESQSTGSKVPSNPTDSWTLSDTIAVIASFVALLQFGALIWTVAVMIGSSHRQLRAYVVMELGNIANVANPIHAFEGQGYQANRGGNHQYFVRTSSLRSN